MDVTGKAQTEINQAVEAAVKDLTPIKVTLATDVLGAAGYEAVRIQPVGAGDHIQLWAKDTAGNWYDINKVGWGSEQGFALPAQYSATTDVYLLADQAGTYALNVKLVDVKNPDAIIAKATGTANVVAPTPPTPPAQKVPTFDVGDVEEQIDAGKDRVEISVPADAPEPAAVLTPAVLEKLVQANKPLVLDIKGVTFTLEPGAIQGTQGASGVRLEAKPLSEDEASDLTGSLPGAYKVAGKVLSLTAASVVGEDTQPVTFAKPVMVTVAYDPASVNPDFLGAYRYSPETKKWDYLGGKVDKDKELVTFTTPHLSEYAVMEYHKTFNDLAGSFAKADIEYLASRYVIYGVTDTKFDPLGNITRAQFCALVARALKLEAPQNAPGFKDVSGSYWAAKEIQAAAASGIVKGYADGTFRPDELINREQLAAMVARALVYAGGGTLPTPDQAQTILARFQDQNRITSGLAQEAALAADKGIVLGTADQRFHPSGTATREQAAAMLARMYRLLP